VQGTQSTAWAGVRSETCNGTEFSKISILEQDISAFVSRRDGVPITNLAAGGLVEELSVVVVKCRL
jgi:hypothetical protein